MADGTVWVTRWHLDDRAGTVVEVITTGDVPSRDELDEQLAEARDAGGNIGWAYPNGSAVVIPAARVLWVETMPRDEDPQPA